MILTLVINERNHSSVWYHSTTRNKLTDIFNDGLIPYSRPTSGPRFPWIYLSQLPFYRTNEDNVLLGVDLCNVDESDIDWIRQEDGDKHQIRVYIAISPQYVKLLDERNHLTI